MATSTDQWAATKRAELVMTDHDNRSLWDLWRMLWRLREAVDRDTLMPPQDDDSEWPDTVPSMRPDPE
jgi:hypothetical protein